MKYIDIDTLKGIDTPAFRSVSPFPWINPQGFLRDEAFEELTANMPDLSLFESHFGYARKNKQAEHSRYTLEYEKGLDISPAWEAFIAELLAGKEKEAAAKAGLGAVLGFLAGTVVKYIVCF